MREVKPFAWREAALLLAQEYAVALDHPAAKSRLEEKRLFSAEHPVGDRNFVIVKIVRKGSEINVLPQGQRVGGSEDTTFQLRP